MGKDSFLIEGVELIPDIDFEHSRPLELNLILIFVIITWRLVVQRGEAFYQWSWTCLQFALKLYHSPLFIWQSGHYNPFPHHNTGNFLSTWVTYTQLWYIIEIVSSSSTHFHSERIGLIRATHYLSCQY